MKHKKSPYFRDVIQQEYQRIFFEKCKRITTPLRKDTRKGPATAAEGRGRETSALSSPSPLEQSKTVAQAKAHVSWADGNSAAHISSPSTQFGEVLVRRKGAAGDKTFTTCPRHVYIFLFSFYHTTDIQIQLRAEFTLHNQDNPLQSKP